MVNYRIKGPYVDPPSPLSTFSASAWGAPLCYERGAADYHDHDNDPDPDHDNDNDHDNDPDRDRDRLCPARISAALLRIGR